MRSFVGVHGEPGLVTYTVLPMPAVLVDRKTNLPSPLSRCRRLRLVAHSDVAEPPYVPIHFAMWIATSLELVPIDFAMLAVLLLVVPMDFAMLVEMPMDFAILVVVLLVVPMDFARMPVLLVVVPTDFARLLLGVGLRRWSFRLALLAWPAVTQRFEVLLVLGTHAPDAP